MVWEVTTLRLEVVKYSGLYKIFFSLSGETEFIEWIGYRLVNSLSCATNQDLFESTYDWDTVFISPCQLTFDAARKN